MKRTEFWKNFSLGKELDIAGRFIYNGLQCFHQMKTFHYEEEIFEFFYNLSVGSERLLKIAAILIEHEDGIDQKEFEKSLITHNHLELLKRVNNKHNLTFSGPQKEFLHILTKFYKTYRYGRYDLNAMNIEGKEKVALHAYLEKHLKIEIDDESLFGITQNDRRIKKFIGKIVGKISSELYSVVQQEARRLNIYTYEVRHASKASKIFLYEEKTFFDEDILWKELLVFFMNSKHNTDFFKFLRDIEPLDFDPALANDYLNSFSSETAKLEVMDELEHHYLEDVEDVADRLEMLGVMGNSSYIFDIDDEEEE